MENVLVPQKSYLPNKCKTITRRAYVKPLSTLLRHVTRNIPKSCTLCASCMLAYPKFKQSPQITAQTKKDRGLTRHALLASPVTCPWMWADEPHTARKYCCALDLRVCMCHNTATDSTNEHTPRGSTGQPQRDLECCGGPLDSLGTFRPSHLLHRSAMG